MNDGSVLFLQQPLASWRSKTTTQHGAGAEASECKRAGSHECPAVILIVSQIHTVFSTVSGSARTGKWCPEEDSNLHALASAST